MDLDLVSDILLDFSDNSSELFESSDDIDDWLGLTMT